MAYASSFDAAPNRPRIGLAAAMRAVVRVMPAGLGRAAAAPAGTLLAWAERMRRERDIDRLCDALEKLNDRQLRVLGLDRRHICEDVEDRYEEIFNRRRRQPRLEAPRSEAA